MGTRKLIAKLRDYLELDRQNQKGKHDKIRTLLKKLKKKQKALEKKLKKAADSKTRKQLKRELKVLYVQRKKGVALHRDIRGKK